MLITLVLIDGQPAAAAFWCLGFALGAVFLKTEFSFTASWRRLIVRGQADGFLGGLLLIAIAATAIVPVAALVPGFGGAIAPIGPSLVIGAFVFGIGMQLANGCGSGTLYTVGGGSGRMLFALAFFIAGSVIGSLHLPAFLRLGGIDPILASDISAPWGGLVATWASLGAGGVRRRRHRAAARRVVHAVAKDRARRDPDRTAVDRGVCRRPPSLERHLRLHGLGRQDRGTVRGGFRRRRVLAMGGAEARARRLDPERHLEPHRPRHDPRRHGRGRRHCAVRAQPLAAARSLLAAALGGLLMGWGARLGFGCNIGAFVGGLASGSLHGWVWFLAALPGCMIGIKLRPLFGLSRE